MKLTLTALTVAATMVASSASAFDPDDVQKLLDTYVCVGCDLCDARLAGADLSRAYYEGGTSLDDADLSGADLTLFPYHPPQCCGE